MAKKAARTRRRGFGAIAHGRKSAMAKHRAEKAEAEENFPVLKRKLDAIRERFKENRAAGRFDYLKSLQEIYALVWQWDLEEIIESRLEIVAKLRGVALRDNANRFSDIVAYCSDFGERTKIENNRYRKNVSRWSRQLDDAFEQEIPPSELISSLKDEVASKAKKSKTMKSSAKKSDAKPKVRKYRWGPKKTRSHAALNQPG
jgi:hypothetical protein